MKPHNADTRSKAEQMIRNGDAPQKIAAALDLKRTTIASWKHKLEAKGEPMPRLIARRKAAEVEQGPAIPEAPVVAPVPVEAPPEAPSAQDQQPPAQPGLCQVEAVTTAGPAQEPAKAGVLYIREDPLLRSARAFARIKALRAGVLKEADIVRGILLIGLRAVEADRGLLLKAGEE